MCLALYYYSATHMYNHGHVTEFKIGTTDPTTMESTTTYRIQRK